MCVPSITLKSPLPTVDYILISIKFWPTNPLLSCQIITTTTTRLINWASGGWRHLCKLIFYTIALVMNLRRVCASWRRWKGHSILIGLTPEIQVHNVTYYFRSGNNTLVWSFHFVVLWHYHCQTYFTYTFMSCCNIPQLVVVASALGAYRTANYDVFSLLL